MKNAKSIYKYALITLLSLWFGATAFAQDHEKAAQPTAASGHVVAVDGADSNAAPDSVTYTDNYRIVEEINQYHKDSVAAQMRGQKPADSLALAARQRNIDSAKALAAGAPVVFDHDTLMFIYVRNGTLAPDERAALYTKRFALAAKEFSAAHDTLNLVDNGTSTDILLKETLLATVTDMDAFWADADRNAMARAEADKIYNALAAHAKNRNLLTILKMVGLSLLVLIALFALFKLTGHVFKKIIDRKIVEKSGVWFKNGLRVRNLELIPSAKLVSMGLFVSGILRYAVYALLLYAALPALFSIFPVTRNLAVTLFSWVVTPLVSMGQSFVAYLPNLLRVIVIIFIMRYVLKFLKYIAREIEAGRLVIPQFYPDWAHATYNILRIFIYAFTLVLIFPLLPDSESSVFRGISVFIGVLFSIGSSSVISNMMAGIVITYMRSFKVGDRIKVGDVFGDVVEKTLFVVRVQTIKKEVITVPNSTILSSNIINYSIAAHEQGVILSLPADVCYDVSWERAEKLLIEAALKTEHVLRDPKPFVLAATLGNYAAGYTLNAYTHRPDLQALIYSDMNKNVLSIFQREGIEMIVPAYEMLRNGEKSTIPVEYSNPT
jgi:small-conductance mechanosensitive channel